LKSVVLQAIEISGWWNRGGRVVKNIVRSRDNLNGIDKSKGFLLWSEMEREFVVGDIDEVFFEHQCSFVWGRKVMQENILVCVHRENGVG
jgi:hypothetical protein